MYKLVDPRTGQPFYVGKGSNDRAWSHLKNHDSKNLLKRAIIETIYKEDNEPIVEILHESLEEKDALRLETAYIKQFGRMLVVDGGLLTNIVLSGPVKRSKNKDQIRECLRKLCYSDKHFELLDSLLSAPAPSAKYKNIQMDATLHTRLKQYCSERDIPLARFTEGLVLCALSGSISGSKIAKMAFQDDHNTAVKYGNY